MVREKIRYEVDPHNRLISKESENETEVKKFRDVYDGYFKPEQDNFLVFHIKKSQGLDVPQQMKFSGNWSLDENHNLVFTLDKWNNQCEGNRLIIKGDIISVNENQLAFQIVTKETSLKEHIYILSLLGTWHADEYNRLAFAVQKERGNSDVLRFEGSWQVNKQNQIFYTFSRETLNSEEKISNTLTFKGYWDISEKYRISYILNEEISSKFDFKISVCKTIKQGLQYEVAIGSSLKNKTIVLSGIWRISDKLGLTFEMKYGDENIRTIILGASCKLDDGYVLDLNLKNRLGEELGIELKLSKVFLENLGESFLKVLSSNKEIELVAGIGFKW